VAEDSEEINQLRVQRLVASVPWTLVALILIYGGLAGDGTKDKILGFGGAFLVTLVALRAARLRLVLGNDIVVVGWFGNKHYAWSELDRFVVNDNGLAMRMKGGLELQIPAFPMGPSLLKTLRESMRTDLEQTLARVEKYRLNRRRAT
jgi:hypothetical protein